MNVYDKNGNALNLLKDSDIEVGTNYAKFSNGLLVCWGNIVIESSQSTKRIYFPFNFIGSPNIVITAGYSNEKNVFVTKGTTNVGYFDAYITEQNAGTKNRRIADYIAIGKWK